MDERRRNSPVSLRLVRAATLAVLAAVAGGCLGPTAVNSTRTRYNEAYRATNDEQILLNIVRLRYADSPVFIDLPNITSQFEVAAGGSDPGPSGSQTNFGIAGMTARDTPTLSYRPREGKDIARALLTPLTADLFSVVNAGANIEQLLLLTINDMNDIPNAPRATAMVPIVPDDNTAFRQGIQLLATLLYRDALELAIGTSEETEGMSDPIPTKQLKGGDLIDAAKDHYVFRAKGDDMMSAVRREKGLVLKIRPQSVNSPEMIEVARLLRVTPGLSRYRVKSELTEEGEPAEPLPSAKDVIYLNMRSIMQILVFLSKGVCVPPEHVAGGIAPTTVTPDGQIYDWTRVTAGLFFVSSQKKRPHHAEVAVHYRGYWFFIPQNDVNSRAALAILEILSSLQESERTNPGLLLTLPVSG